MKTRKVTLTVSVEVSTLTQEDCNSLIEYGYMPDDMEQIDRGCRECVYKDWNPAKYGDQREHRISRKKAIELLGKEEYLSGIGRASFHCSCGRNYGTALDGEGYPYVSFDLSKWWK